MKLIITVWMAAFLAAAPCLSAETPLEHELSFSLGSGLGDFGSTLAGGVSLNLRVGSNLLLEPELFYYYDPAEPSHTEGLAVTSTGLSAGLGVLIRCPLAAGRILLDLGLSLGVMHVSETREFDALRQITSLMSSEAYVGSSAGVHFRLDGRSGVRFDARLLHIPWDGRSIPRLSIGYVLRY